MDPLIEGCIYFLCKKWKNLPTRFFPVTQTWVFYSRPFQGVSNVTSNLGYQKVMNGRSWIAMLVDQRVPQTFSPWLETCPTLSVSSFCWCPGASGFGRGNRAAHCQGLAGTNGFLGTTRGVFSPKTQGVLGFLVDFQNKRDTNGTKTVIYIVFWVVFEKRVFGMFCYPKAK